ncbi:MAG TPA: tetratricopeptide repeat protein, partial [Methylomirabilota bacterium]|nr:tetratricopeptide repeat protein [Methylomirabilota bacterium]
MSTIRDRYGLSLSTSSAAAGGAYAEGVDALLAAHAAPEACFDSALAADPDFALAHLGRARALQLLGRSALAQAAAARARELGAVLDRRERQHVEA